MAEGGGGGVAEGFGAVALAEGGGGGGAVFAAPGFSHHGTADALGAALAWVLVAAEGVITTGAVADGCAAVLVVLVVGWPLAIVVAASTLSFGVSRPVSEPIANAIMTSNATPPAPRYVAHWRFAGMGGGGDEPLPFETPMMVDASPTFSSKLTGGGRLLGCGLRRMSRPSRISRACARADAAASAFSTMSERARIAVPRFSRKNVATSSWVAGLHAALIAFAMSAAVW